MTCKSDRAMVENMDKYIANLLQSNLAENRNPVINHNYYFGDICDKSGAGEADGADVVFSGVCELTDGETGDVVMIYGSAKQAVEQGMPAKIAKRLFGKKGLAAGTCKNKKDWQKKTIDCVDVSCSGTCKVFSMKKGPVDPNEKEEDEGVGPVTMKKGRFYWCKCV